MKIVKHNKSGAEVAMNDDIFDPRFPMLVNAELACIVGLDESIFLQQLHYWQLKYELVPSHQHDGRTWIYNSAESWRAQFPFWNADKIGRITRSLRSRNLVFATQKLNAYKYDKTIWYSLNYPLIRELILKKRAQHIEITHSAKMQNGGCKNAESNLRDCITESVNPQDLYHRLSTETTSENNNIVSDVVVNSEIEKLVAIIPASVMSAAIKTEIRQALGKPDGYIICESNINYAIKNHKAKNGKTGRQQSLGGFICRAIAEDYAAEERSKSIQLQEVAEKTRESVKAVNAKTEEQQAAEAADRQKRLEVWRSLPESIRIDCESELEHMISVNKIIPIPGNNPGIRELWLATLVAEGRIGRKPEQASV